MSINGSLMSIVEQRFIDEHQRFIDEQQRFIDEQQRFIDEQQRFIDEHQRFGTTEKNSKGDVLAIKQTNFLILSR